jgi:hypothetical protein
MIFYHASTPDRIRSILSEGFQDGCGSYLTRSTYVGVWFSDRPLDENEGASGHTVLWIEAPEREFGEYEWKEPGKPYREFLVPATLANKYGPARRTVECPDCETEYGGAHCPDCLAERRLKRRHERSLRRQQRAKERRNDNAPTQ